jgi:hypothetical protein
LKGEVEMKRFTKFGIPAVVFLILAAAFAAIAQAATPAADSSLKSFVRGTAKP